MERAKQIEAIIGIADFSEQGLGRFGASRAGSEKIRRGKARIFMMILVRQGMEGMSISATTGIRKGFARMRISGGRIQNIGTLEQNPAGRDVFVTTERFIAAMGMGKCGRCDQQRTGHGFDFFLLVQKFGLAFGKFIVEIHRP